MELASPTLHLPTQQFVLRPYQQEAVDESVSFLTGKKEQNGVVVLPTGSGKSLVIANIVKELGEPCLVFQPSKEILAQNVEKFRSYGGHCGIYSASAGEKKMANVTFATIGSVVNKKHLLDRFKYVLMDECHLAGNSGMYSEVFEHMGRRVLGLTATPYRLSSTVDMKTGAKLSILKFLTRTNPRIFQKVVYYVQNRRLFDDGHLAKLVYHDVKAINRQNLQPNSTGADYTDASVRAEYRASGFDNKVVRVVNRLFEIGRKNCLVFTRFVQEAEMVARSVPGAALVTAESSAKERDRVISGFRSGRIRCVCNVGILTTGFDYPQLEAVVMARPTRSLGLWYQVVGRGIRPHPNKDHTMVIDMGGNLQQFGKVEDLELSEEGGWHIRSHGRALTNVPFGEPRWKR